MANNPDLKERVREFWQEHPCGTKFSDAATGSREFFERVEAHRYEKEWHIPAAANFAGTRGLKVLEIGCGIGTVTGGSIYALNRWHQHRQEAAIPETPLVPELKTA